MFESLSHLLASKWGERWASWPNTYFVGALKHYIISPGQCLSPCKHAIELALVIGNNWASAFCSSPPVERQKLHWILTVPFQIVQWCFITYRLKARFLGKAFVALHELIYLKSRSHRNFPQNTTVLSRPLAFLFVVASAFTRWNPIHLSRLSFLLPGLNAFSISFLISITKSLDFLLLLALPHSFHRFSLSTHSVPCTSFEPPGLSDKQDSQAHSSQRAFGINTKSTLSSSSLYEIAG